MVTYYYEPWSSRALVHLSVELKQVCMYLQVTYKLSINRISINR